MRIKLKNNVYTDINDEDYYKISEYKWYLAGRGYAIGNHKNNSRRTVKMHRLLTSAKKGEVVDHIDRNPLNNRKQNLRIVNQSLNTLNAKVFNTSKTGIKGVSYYKKRGCYRSYITINYKQIHLGYFETVYEAKNARKNYELVNGIIS
jgi:hypothetical protein